MRQGAHATPQDRAARTAASISWNLWRRRLAAVAGVVLLLGVGASGIEVEPAAATLLGSVGLVGLVALILSAALIPPWLERAERRRRRRRRRKMNKDARKKDAQTIFAVTSASLAAAAAFISPVAVLLAPAALASAGVLGRARDEAVLTKALDSAWLARAASWMRVFGPALLGAWFLAFWTFTYLLTWSLDTDAYERLSAPAAFGDFVYMAVSGVVGNVPSGLLPSVEPCTHVDCCGVPFGRRVARCLPVGCPPCAGGG